MLTVGSVVEHLERLAPTRLAAEWDNVGLLLGQRTAPVRRVMTCLTITPVTAAEAVGRQAELIVSHHPILFRGSKRLTGDSAEGRVVLELARAGVAVHSPHTAFDNAAGGINDLLANRLGLEGVGPLQPGQGPRQVKLTTFVPEGELPRVSDALFAAGAGRIGEYRECSFRLPGTGTFFGSDASNPAVGQKGRREEVPEWRLEVVCPEGLVGQAVAALRKAHPYEEPAFDLYPLTPGPSAVGVGRVGQLRLPVALGKLARKVRTLLRCGPVQLVGDAGAEVRRVAIVCGAGGELLHAAGRAGADVFLTGEMRYHDYLAARAQGVALVLPGHHATERLGVEDLAVRLRAHWPELEVWASEHEADPVTWV